MMKFVRQLYPTGRAYKIPEGSNYELLHDAINESVYKYLDDVKSIYDTLLPDNDNFTEEDAAIWEKRLAITASGDLEQRKDNIGRKLNYPNNTLGRQSLVYIQDQLQRAGFNIYVHQNKFDDGMGGFTTINPGDGTGSYTQHGLGVHGISSHGSTGFPYESIVANYVNKALEYAPIFTPTQLKATFFVGDQTFPNTASVSAERENELRKLLLTLKPQQMVVYLLVNYI